MEAKTELQKNAVATARRNELETFQRALDIQWLDSRMEDGGMGRCLALIKREEEMEKDFQERTDHAAIVNDKAEKETALGISIAKVRREEVCEYQRRHYLRERDPSLRQLTRKLEAGYVCRDLQQQILHNEYRRLQEKAEERRANSVLHEALYSDQEARIAEEQRKMHNNIQHCKYLQQQLVDKQRVKQCQYEDSLIEKKMLDDIMRTLSDEDKRELQQKKEQMERTKKEMVMFKLAREAWKEKQKKLVVLEELRIEEQKKAASDRSSSVIAERERKVREKEELNEKIAAKILSDEAARLERENIIKQLQEQEYLEKNSLDDKAEREKLERVKRETKEALTGQMENRKRLAAEQRVSEAEFRKSTEAKMAADEQKEREKERRVKEKNRNYSKELLEQIANNAQRRERDRVIDENSSRNVFEYEKAWQKEVKEERKKILEEHVPHLVGYLQAGVTGREELHAESERDSERAVTSATRPQRLSKCNEQCNILRNY